MLGIAFISLLLSPLWFLFESAMALAAVPIAQHINAAPKLHTALCAWIGSASSHAIQMCLWWIYAFSGEDWIFSPGSWVDTIDPMNPESVANQRRVLPYYLLYLAYAWYSTCKDLRRNWNKLHNPSQIMFFIHHLLTLFLVMLSLDNGAYRVGVLTRIAHDPADIVMYYGKVYTAMYDQGKGDRGILSVWYLAVIGTWVLTRVLFYGYIVVEVTRMAVRHSGAWSSGLASISFALIAASWLMLFLQLIWAVHIGDMTRKFLRSGRVVVDAIDKGQTGNAQTKGGKEQVDRLLAAATEDEVYTQREKTA